jgi:TolA-binding protein
MSDDDDQLDPLLAAAYGADRRVLATLDTAGARERILLAVSDRIAATAQQPVPQRSPWFRRGFALAVAGLFGATLGFAAGRITRPEPAPSPSPVATPEASIVPVDAPPPADAALDAAPAIDAPVAHVERHRPETETRPLAEPLLIDQARAALRRGLPADALDALERHRSQYPDGQLREERDVLLIEVALAQTRLGDANELIARYQQQYPHGGLRHRVEALQTELDHHLRDGVH